MISLKIGSSGLRRFARPHISHFPTVQASFPSLTLNPKPKPTLAAPDPTPPTPPETP